MTGVRPAGRDGTSAAAAGPRTAAAAKRVGIGDGDPPPPEGGEVGLDGDAVDRDGLLDAPRRQSQRAGLMGGPDQQQVGRSRAAEEGLGGRERVEESAACSPGRAVQQDGASSGYATDLVVDHLAGRGLAGRRDADGRAGPP